MIRHTLLALLTLAVGAGPAIAAKAQAKPKAPPKAAAPAKPVSPKIAPTLKPEGLTLEQALATARASQPRLRQAQADIAGAQAGAEQSRASMRPQLSAAASYQFGPSRQNVNQVGVPVTNLGNYSLGVNADYLLYDFGQAESRYRAAQAQVEVQGQNARQTSLATIADVRIAYFTAYANQNLLRVAQETRDNQLRQQRQTRGLVEIGTRPPIDLAQTSAEVANAQLQVINAQNALQTAKARLNQAMGVERGTDYVIAAEGMPAVANEDQPLDRLLAESAPRRPELAAMAARVQAQELLVQAAEFANYPVLRSSAGAGTNGTPITAPNNNWSAGLGIAWPLYTGGAREAQAAQARALLDSLRAQSDTLQLDLRLSLEQARLGIVAAKAAILAAKEATRAARVQLDLAEGRYEAGVGSVIELGDARLGYANAQAQEVRESYNLAIARAQLLQAMGRD